MTPPALHPFVLLVAAALAGCGVDVIVHDRSSADAGPGTCSDHATNGSESDTDCGGTCEPCEEGVRCGSDPDCASLACADGRCLATWDVHPRLWLNRRDLPRLRAWANDSNEVWTAGVEALAARARSLMDSPAIGEPGNQLPGADSGGADYTPVPTEAYLEALAFESLLHPDDLRRADAAARARTLFLHLLDRATTPGDPMNAEAFIRGGRARALGEALALTADWIHDSLTLSDRQRTRALFLRWARLLEESPGGPVAATETRVNDAGLYEAWDPHRSRLRGSISQDNLMRLRGFGLLALALDDADDGPDEPGALRAFVKKAIGQWLFVAAEALRTDAAGGFSGDGFAYGEANVLYPGELAWALETAGYATEAGVARFGPAGRAHTHPWWGEVTGAWLHAIPSRRSPDGRFQPSWFGESQDYDVGDPTAAFATVGLIERAAGQVAQVQAARWIAMNVPAGAASRFLARLNDPWAPARAVLAFLVSDPEVAVPDPRPAQDLRWNAPGLGRLSTRTSWGNDARQVDFRLGWSANALQADGGTFDFFRQGEWLTKQRTGGGVVGALTEYQNALALVTSAVETPGELFGNLTFAERGSQLLYGVADDPLPPVWSHGEGWDWISGDAAPLWVWDSGARRVDDVQRAVRELAWLQPDVLVVLDRVEGPAGRSKRFWLNLPGPATQEGPRVSASTAGGQQLFVTTLLPAGAAAEATIVTLDPSLDELDQRWAFAPNDPMNAPYSFPSDPEVPGARRLRVEAAGGPAMTTFLHVLEGADAAATATIATALASATGAAATGVAVGPWLFVSVDRQGGPAATVVPLPKGATRRLVAGLVPGGAYALTLRDAGAVDELVVAEGGSIVADPNGIVAF